MIKALESRKSFDYKDEINKYFSDKDKSLYMADPYNSLINDIKIIETTINGRINIAKENLNKPATAKIREYKDKLFRFMEIITYMLQDHLLDQIVVNQNYKLSINERIKVLKQLISTIFGIIGHACRKKKKEIDDVLDYMYGLIDGIEKKKFTESLKELRTKVVAGETIDGPLTETMRNYKIYDYIRDDNHKCITV